MGQFIIFTSVLLLFRSTSFASTHCDSSKNGVFLTDNDLKSLLDEDILTESQMNYLYDNYYRACTHVDEQHLDSNQNTFSFYNIPYKIYDVVSNSLHGIGCVMLTSSYIVFMYVSSLESAYFLIGVTLVYFYVFHMMLHLVANTVLSIIICMYCCLMPTIIATIYLCDPYFLNGISIIMELFDTMKQALLVDGIPHEQRYDEFLVSIVPKQVFICVFGLHAITICTSTIYLVTFYEYHYIQFAIFGIYSFCVYSLFMMLSLFSVQSSKINGYANKLKIKKSKYCDVRYIYSSFVYWIIMFFLCIFTNNDILFTIALVSGLNTLHLSFPIFLFVDIFHLNFNEYLDTFKQLFVGDEKGSIESLTIVLGLLQKHDVKYRAYIIVNIMIHMVLLELCMLYSHWIPMTYSVFALFILSFSIKTDIKWALSLHLPITYSLLKACFVFISVIDIAPENTSLWVLIICIRCMISVLACFQINRAISWLTMTHEQWNEFEMQHTKLHWFKLVTHGIALYFICCLLLFFGDLEANYLISWVFVVFGINYGTTLIVSIGYILCKANYCLAFFIINISICLRLYVICCDLWIAKLITFIAAFITFIILDDEEGSIYPNHIANEKEMRIATISSICLYGSYGWFYDCNWLIMSASVIFSVWMFQEIRNKCIALIVIAILWIVLFQTGFIFALSLFSVSEGNTSLTLEFSMLQYYFEKIVNT